MAALRAHACLTAHMQCVLSMQDAASVCMCAWVGPDSYTMP